MKISIILLLALVSLSAFLLPDSRAQEGAAEKIGRRIDQGLERIGEGVQEAWSEVRVRVDKLGVQGRVYGRLRWDKSFAEEPIEVEVEAKDVVVLTGRVADEATHQKALQLAKDTVGVREVLDRLRVEPSRQPTLQPAGK